MIRIVMPRRAAQRAGRQQGQALLFALAFAISAGLVSLLLFNSGMLANSKTRLQNAADAAAYSAGVLQARDHNFSAYTNRAMVANQVAVVQLVSLKSYLEDAGATRKRMDGPVLRIEELIPTSKSTWDRAKSVGIEDVNTTFAAIAPAAVSGLDRLIQAFAAAQEAHHMATVVDMALVADEVVKRNSPGALVTRGAFSLGKTAIQVKSWGNSTRAHRANDPSAEADRFADVVVSDKSTDAFTRERGSVPLPVWASTVQLCTMAPNYVSSTTVFNFFHDGGSVLSTDKKRWLALDATLGTGFQTCTFWVPCLTGICYVTEFSPLIDDNAIGGSGGAVAGASGAYDSTNGYKNNPSETANYGGALINPATFMPAYVRYRSTGPGNTLDGAGGLQDYYRDVANPAESAPPNQAPENNGGANAITFEVERPATTIRTSSKLLPGSTIVKMDDSLKGDTLRTLSSAHAYFYRPKTDDLNSFTRNGWRRADGKTEVANLFNPYWQARLVDRSQADRAASWAAQ